MSEYNAPSITNLDVNMESVYVNSGKTPPTPPVNPDDPDVPPVGPSKCWVDWQFDWTGHNNGGHSICHVSAKHCGDHSGSMLVMRLSTNFNIKEVKNASGYTISDVGLRSFTITRHGHFNQSDSIGFNVEIVADIDNGLHGAIGEQYKDIYFVRLDDFSCG